MIDLLPSNFLDIADRSSKTDVSNTEQSSSLVYPRNNFNSNRNSNSNSKINNKNVKVIDETIKEIDQSYQKVDNTTGQGIVGTPKKKKVASLFNSDPKPDISASVSKSAKSINNNNNNDDDDVSNTIQSSSLVHTRNNYNSTSNNKMSK